jgi:hypothetical protein
MDAVDVSAGEFHRWEKFDTMSAKVQATFVPLAQDHFCKWPFHPMGHHMNGTRWNGIPIVIVLGEAPSSKGKAFVDLDIVISSVGKFHCGSQTTYSTTNDDNPFLFRHDLAS